MTLQILVTYIFKPITKYTDGPPLEHFIDDENFINQEEPSKIKT
jgi:hypothetical protein